MERIIAIPNGHPAARNRYLYDAERRTLSAVQASPLALLNPKTSPAVRELMLAFAKEPFRRSRPPKGDESVAEFFTRRFGPGPARTASAFVHGIYAADPAKLSLRSGFGILHGAEARGGSVVLGMLRGPRSAEDVAAEQAAWAAIGPLGKEREGWNMYALAGGMEGLTATLEEKAKAAGVDVKKGVKVDRLAPTDTRVEITTVQGSLRVDHVVAALPPRKLEHALASPLPHLSANPSTTVGVVNVVYGRPPSQVHPDGFGYLIPRGEAGSNPEGALGVVFDSTALPGVDGGGLDGHVTKLTVMMGGPHWSSYASANGEPLPTPKSAEELVAPALAHLHRVFPHLTAHEPLLVVPNLNHECIPTYAPGHGARLRETHEAINAGPWAERLSLVGAGYGGVSVNDCVLGGELVAAGLRDGTVTGLERWANWE